MKKYKRRKLLIYNPAKLQKNNFESLFMLTNQKKIRVFMFVYLFPPEYTGASIQAITLAKELNKHGVEITFVTATLGVDGDCGVDLYDNFKVIRIKNTSENNTFGLVLYWIRLFLFLLRNHRKYDIIHSIGLFTQNNILPVFGKILRKKCIVKTTLSNEIELLHKNFRNKGLESKFNYFSSKLYDFYVCISNDIKKSVLRSSVNIEKVEYIPNGIDQNKFYPVLNKNMNDSLKNELNLPNGIIYSYVGVIHERKMVDWLILNWLDVFKNLDDSYLLIAGPCAREKLMADGGGLSYYNSLINLVNSSGASEKVFFRPFRLDVEKYYQISNFFINPSLSEGLSNSLLESMACGVIPIVSKTSGSVDVINHLSNGFLFNIGDAEMFKSILRLSRNIDKKILKFNAKITIEKNFSIKNVCFKYINLYNRALC